MECNEEDLLLLIALHRITFLTLAEKIILLKKLDSFNALALMSIEDIISTCGRNISKAVWNGKENLRAAQKELAIIQAKKINYVTYLNPEYPALLREISDAPLLLFYRGNLNCLAGKTVSVVGTRKITAEAKKDSVKFAYDAVNAGYTVVSGLANGVDGAAHIGAVAAYYDSVEKSASLPEGKTAAVLPCGCDTVTPASHARLAEQIIISGGCLISEYVPGTPAENWRFVQRNRIIAALSPATVVMQAPAGSGALITADFALGYGRDVVFHKAAFSEMAAAVKKAVEKDLDAKLALGKVSKYKRENTPEKYLEAGAPVVNDFQDFCRCIAEIPGTRSVNNEQLKLF